MAETPITFSNHGQQMVGMIHDPARGRPGPALLMCHGFTGNRMEAHFLFVKMARKLAAAGYVVMRFDFRGSGESAGEFADVTIPGEVDDAKIALAYLRAHPAVDPERVTLLGLSMGGAVAATVAGQDEQLSGLILWSAVARLSSDWPELKGGASPPLGLQPDGRFDMGGLLLGPALLATRGEVEPLASINHFARPLLIIHGTEDKTVPPSHAEQYQQAVGGRASLHWIQNADHVFSAHAWEQEVFNITLDWLQENLPA